MKNYRLAVASASEQNHIIMTFGAVVKVKVKKKTNTFLRGGYTTARGRPKRLVCRHGGLPFNLYGNFS